MALQVWLPLNGDVKNYGVSGNLQFTGTSTNAVGKVTTNSQENNSNTTGGYVSNIPIDLGMKQSMFCWVNFNSFYATSSLTGVLGQHRYSSNQGMGITAKYVSNSTGYLSVNTGNGSSRTFVTYCGNTLLSSDKWYHVGYTYDGNTVTLYVNGNVDGTFAISDMKIVSDYLILFAWSLNGTSGTTYHANYRLKGKLNDVRIYDHCLSLKEVKNLAKGLMLHYTLSRSGANLLIGSSNYLSTTLTKSAKDGYQSYPIYANNLSEGTYIYSIRVTKGTLSSGHTTGGVDYTKGYWSLWLYTDSTTYSASSYSHYSTATCYSSSSGAYLGRIGDVYYWKISITSAKPNCAVRVNVYSDGTNNATINFGEIKLEAYTKDVPTPWIPNSADTLYTKMGFANNIEDDTSGYNNNGTRTNITTWNTDTARYLSSMVFNGSNAYLQLSKNLGNVYNSDFSLSVWLKPSVAKRGVILSEYQATGASNVSFELTATLQLRVWWNGTPDIKTTNGISVNAWSHVVITKTSTQILFYVNGSLFYTYNQSGGFSERVSNALPRIGDDYRTGTDVDYNGLMSDFRLYATALSESDVKELYETSASIDKNGNMHCYELVEV